MVDPHRLAEARSLAYHRAVAERLPWEPEVLERARARVKGWMIEGLLRPYANEWTEILARAPSAVAAALVDDSENGCARRQASPFAGALAPRERWRLWREVRERLAGS